MSREKGTRFRLKKAASTVAQTIQQHSLQILNLENYVLLFDFNLASVLTSSLKNTHPHGNKDFSNDSDKKSMISVLLLWLGLGQSHAHYTGYDYPKDKPVFIQSTTLANCMLIAADKYPKSKLKPSEIHSKSFRGRICVPNEDAFMLYLQAGSSRKCDFETGHEEALKTWVLQQPDNTVDPLAIFEKALELNEGNLSDSLLTIHQMMRNNARWFSKDNYEYKSSEAEAKVFLNKFVDIRGDLRDRGGKYEGDHAGSWYRMWGMALWRTRKSFNPVIESNNCTNLSTSSAPERTFRNMQAYSMAIGAEALKPLLVLAGSKYKPELKDLSGKTKMNAVGADLGASLSSYLADGVLNLSPEYRKKIFGKVCEDKGYLTSPK